MGSGRLVVLMGPPGVGKGTLANKGVNEVGFITISTGQILREHISDKTILGASLQKIIDRGDLVPDFLVDEIFKSWFEVNYDDDKNIMVDGYPRTVAQAKFLVDLLRQKGLIENSVLYVMEASADVIRDRILRRIICPNKLCGRVYSSKNKLENQACDSCKEPLLKRKDDTLETAANRLTEYFRIKQGIVDYFKDNHITVTSVDTSAKSQDEVFTDFKSKVCDKN
jgi:adenylate kinase